MVTCFPPLQPACHQRARCAVEAQWKRSGCAADAQRMRGLKPFCFETGLTMPHGSNCIIHFCGWCLVFFSYKIVHVGDFILSLLRLYLCLLFISYIYLRIPSYLGLRGEPFIFSDGFFRCFIQRFYTNSYVADFVLWVILEVTHSVTGTHSEDCKCDIGPGLKSQPGIQFFSLILVQIHTHEFIQLLYKLYSTNSYTVWFLYQFIQFLYDLYSTNSYKV
jgi:hypothetical protein